MHILIKEGNLEMRLLDTALPSRRDTTVPVLHKPEEFFPRVTFPGARPALF